MRNRRFLFITITVVVLLVAGSGLAAAATADEPAPELVDTVEGQGDVIGWLFDMTTLFWWFLPTEAPSTELPSEPVCDPTGDDGADPVEDGCFRVEDVAGPNGQLNHGSFVSAFVHWLKAQRADSLAADSGFTYDGPQGQLVRDIARSNLGKDAAELDNGDGDVTTESAEVEGDTDRPGPPDHAAANGHGKKDKPNKKPRK